MVSTFFVQSLTGILAQQTSRAQERYTLNAAAADGPDRRSRGRSRSRQPRRRYRGSPVGTAMLLRYGLGGIVPAVVLIGLASSRTALVAFLVLSPLPPPAPRLHSGAEGMQGSVLLAGIAIVCFFMVDSSAANWGALYLADGLRAARSIAALGFPVIRPARCLPSSSATGWYASMASHGTIRAGAVVDTPAGRGRGSTNARCSYQRLRIGRPWAVSCPALTVLSRWPRRQTHRNHQGQRRKLRRVGGRRAVVGAIVAASAPRLGFLPPLALAVVMVILAGAFAAARV
jgi:hypothetical protein